jgi:hypothetical protein
MSWCHNVCRAVKTCRAVACIKPLCSVVGAFIYGRLRLKCDGTRAETRFHLSAKRTSPFKLAGTSVQSTTGSRGVRIIGSNAGYAKFRGSVKGTGYPLLSPVSPSLPLPCVTVCHHISTGLCLIEDGSCRDLVRLVTLFRTRRCQPRSLRYAAVP